MNKKGFSNTFNKGIDMDTSVNKYANDTYYDAENIRVINRDSLSSGCIVNINGNKETINLGDDSWEVKASTTIDDTLVLFSALNHKTTIDIPGAITEGTELTITIGLTPYVILFSATPGDDSYIFTMGLSTTNEQLIDKLYQYGVFVNSCYLYNKTEINIVSNNGNIAVSSVASNGSVVSTNFEPKSLISSVDNYDSSESLKALTIIHEGALDLHLTDYVSVSSRYESDSVRKVYWADGINPLRFLKLGSNYSQYDPSDFDHIQTIGADGNSVVISVEEKNGGSLIAGKYQYCIQYISDDGASSVFTSFSRMLAIDEYSESTQVGSDIEVNSNKSILVSISNLFIEQTVGTYRLLSLFYSDLDSVPIIRIVSQGDTGKTLTVVDSGIYYGDITLEELRTFNQSTISPKLISNKDNILFAGNLNEDIFFDQTIADWDSRAYAFSGYNGTAKIYDHPQSLGINDHYSLINADGTGDNVIPGGPTGSFTDWQHSTLNAVNTDNELFYNNLSQPTYAYHPDFDPAAPLSGYVRHPDGRFFGLKGKNLSILFRKYEADSKYGKAFTNSKDREYTLQAGSQTTKAIECQPDEVYRIGIVFFNDKGQSSFAKWIADVRMPYNMQKVTGLTTPDGVEYTYTTGILEVTLDDSPGFDWQIVRVKRSNFDKTIRGRGIVSPLMKDSTVTNGSLRPYVHDDTSVKMMSNPEISSSTLSQANNDIQKDFVEFISAESKFNSPKNVDYSGDKLVLSHTSYGALRTVIDLSGNKDTVIEAESLSHIREDSNISGLTEKYDINGSIYANTEHFSEDVEPNDLLIGGEKYINQFYLPVTGDPESFSSKYPSRCSGVVLALDSDISLTDASADVLANIMGYILSDNDISRYGGYSEGARANNEYIAYSNINSRNDVLSLCEFGDTYHTVMPVVRGLFNSDNGTRKSFQQQVRIFSSSQIDCDRRSDNILKYYSPVSRSVNDGREFLTKSFLQETVAEGINLYPENYNANSGNLYVYNPAYSRQGDAKTFYPEPEGFEYSSNNVVKVNSSQIKLNGEKQDSWLNFLVSDFIEVDGRYGALNGLESFKSNLVFFQEDAIGFLSVNERSIISDSSGKALSLGTGGVLERYDYISFNSGVSNSNDIITSRGSIYFIDENSKSFSSIRNPDSSIAKVAGVDSFFFDNIIKGASRRLGFDIETEEILINTNGKTICYNEILESFTSRYSINPNIFISTPKKLISQKFDYTENNLNYLYAHNDGERGLWYPSIYREDKSMVSLIINPNSNVINSFDNLSLRTNVYNPSENAPEFNEIIYETVDRIIFRNSYINDMSIESATSSTSLSTPKIKRIARAWNAQVPLTYDGNRFVDSYIMVTLEFDNNKNKLFKLHDIITYFRETNN